MGSPTDLCHRAQGLVNPSLHLDLAATAPVQERRTEDLQATLEHFQPTTAAAPPVHAKLGD